MSKKGGVTQVSITLETIFKILAVLAGAALLYFLRDIVLLLIVSILLAAVIDPFADWMQKRALPRGLAVILVYATFSLFATVALLLIVPNVVTETSSLLTRLGPYLEQAEGVYALQVQLQQAIAKADVMEVVYAIEGAGFSEAVPEAAAFIFSIFGGFLTTILILVLAFYFVVEEGVVKRSLTSITPKQHRKRIERILQKSRKRLGYWIRGQLLLMVIIFAITYTILSILGVPYALVLALIAGLFEIIPFIGPIVAAMPAMLIALSDSWWLAFFVGLTYFFLQQLEGDYLTPKIMQKVAGLNPIASIVAVLVGFQIAGVIGALLSIPLTMILGVIWAELLAVYDS